MQSLAELPIDYCCNTWPGETQIVVATVQQVFLIPDSWMDPSRMGRRQSQGRYKQSPLQNELIRLSPLNIADSLKKRLISSANILHTSMKNLQNVYIIYCFCTSPNCTTRVGTWSKLMLYDSAIIIRLVDSNLNIFIGVYSRAYWVHLF